MGKVSKVEKVADLTDKLEEYVSKLTKQVSYMKECSDEAYMDEPRKWNNFDDTDYRVMTSRYEKTFTETDATIMDIVKLMTKINFAMIDW